MNSERALIRYGSKDIERADLFASVKFLTIVLVFFLVPNERIDILFGLNLRPIWLIIVFLSGLSFLGYILSRVIEPERAIWVTGLVGSFVSPSLTISSLSEQTRRYPEYTDQYTITACISTIVMFPRLLAIVGFINVPLASSLWLPFFVMTAVAFIATVLLWSRIQTKETPTVELETAFRVRSAVVFGGVVAGILLIINIFGADIPSMIARGSIIFLVVVKAVKNMAIAWVTGARKMAWQVTVILVGSVSSGTAFMLLL